MKVRQSNLLSIVSQPTDGYFMYPQAETAEGRVDPFDPDAFKYEMTVKEI